MKFRDLAVGQPFRLQGAHFVKTGPLAATPLAGGAARLIARSAEVDTGDPTPAPAAEAAAATLSVETVRTALDRLYDEALRQLDRLDGSAASRAALQATRHQVLRELGLGILKPAHRRGIRSAKRNKSD